MVTCTLAPALLENASVYEQVWMLMWWYITSFDFSPSVSHYSSFEKLIDARMYLYMYTYVRKARLRGAWMSCETPVLQDVS